MHSGLHCESVAHNNLRFWCAGYGGAASFLHCWQMSPATCADFPDALWQADLEIALTPGGIAAAWDSKPGDMLTTVVQILGYKLKYKSLWSYKILVSDGMHKMWFYSNQKHDIAVVLQRKKDAILNAIVRVDTHTVPHPNKDSKVPFMQYMTVLGEGGMVRGEPSLYEGPAGDAPACEGVVTDLLPQVDKTSAQHDGGDLTAPHSPELASLRCGSAMGAPKAAGEQESTGIPAMPAPSAAERPATTSALFGPWLEQRKEVGRRVFAEARLRFAAKQVGANVRVCWPGRRWYAGRVVSVLKGGAFFECQFEDHWLVELSAKAVGQGVRDHNDFAACNAAASGTVLGLRRV